MIAIQYVHRENCPAETECESALEPNIWRCTDCGIRTRVVIRVRGAH